jgi:hypothetical protein
MKYWLNKKLLIFLPFLCLNKTNTEANMGIKKWVFHSLFKVRK